MRHEQLNLMVIINIIGTINYDQYHIATHYLFHKQHKHNDHLYLIIFMVRNINLNLHL